MQDCNCFGFGVIIGMIIVIVFASAVPLYFIPVQNELVKTGHGYYDSTTGNFKLKECN